VAHDWHQVLNLIRKIDKSDEKQRQNTTKFDCHLTLIWIVLSVTFPWKTAARNTRSPQSKNTDKTENTGAGKENLQEAIKTKIQLGEGKQSLRGEKQQRLAP